MKKSGYYAIIPSEVMCDKNLGPSSKLIYGQMIVLSKKEGYCWATNDYFAEIHNVSKRSVASWVSQLKKEGYITLEFSNNHTVRKIYITNKSRAIKPEVGSQYREFDKSMYD